MCKFFLLLYTPPTSTSTCSQVLVCRPTTPVDAVLHFLDAVRALPHIQFCLLNLDCLDVTVRDRGVACILDPERPIRSLVDNGLVLAFRTQTGLDAFNAVLDDVTPEDLPGNFVRESFARDGLQDAVADFTIVAGRAGGQQRLRLLLALCVHVVYCSAADGKAIVPVSVTCPSLSRARLCHVPVSVTCPSVSRARHCHGTYLVCVAVA